MYVGRGTVVSALAAAGFRRPRYARFRARETGQRAVLAELLDNDIGEVRIYSRDEKKQEDMRLRISDERVKFYIGDVRDGDSVLQAMHGVNYVFHAAALKQVPSCEFYPLEAVRTNVLGAENVMNAAVASGVERLVALSTDKAVYPINADFANDHRGHGLLR